MAQHTERAPAAAAWKLIPFLAGLALSPILFGSVKPLQQAMVGALLGLSLLALTFEPAIRSNLPRMVRAGWWLLILFGLVLPLVPLPSQVVGLISPERLALAKEFPLSPNEPIRYLTLTLSPAATQQRVWELLLVGVTFCLGRRVAAFGMHRAFAMTLCLALAALAGSDVWYRIHGGDKFLGLWQDYSHHGAGTFANRNHFADWIFVATLFVLGWIFKASKRTEKANGPIAPSRWPTVFAGLCIAFAALMAVLSGSRGAPIAFLIGLAAFGAGLVFLVNIRVHVTAGGILGSLLILAAMIYASGHALDRLAAGHDLSYKAIIWRDTWKIVRAFPICGTGLGSFDIAFAHYRTAVTGSTSLFAENEYLQSLADSGIPLTILFLTLIVWSLTRLIQFAVTVRTPMVIGALAAIIAFLVHSYVEFVFHVESATMLVAAIFGWLHGMRDLQRQPTAIPPPTHSAVFGRLAFALALLATCAVNAYAWQLNEEAEQARTGTEEAALYARSLLLWPGYFDRVQKMEKLIAWKDSRRIMGVPISPFVEAEIQRERRLDPLNWRLRWDYFLSRMTEFPDDRFAEAWRIIHLEPTTPSVPLHFAHQFAKEDEADLPFLRAAAEFPENLNEVYNIAWSIKPDGDLLWKVTPNNDAGLQALGTFALAKSMRRAALLAFERMSSNAPPELRAEDFLNARRPDLALDLLKIDSPHASYVRSRAYFQLGKFAASIQAAEAIWSTSDHRWQIDPSTSQNAPKEAEAAEAIYQLSAQHRDLAKLRTLASKSNIPRITWIVFDTERSLGKLEDAARTGIKLAGQLLGESGLP